MLVKKKDGWHLYARKKGKNGKRRHLGGPYHTKEEALRREAQVEWFKHHRK